MFMRKPSSCFKQCMRCWFLYIRISKWTCSFYDHERSTLGLTSHHADASADMRSDSIVGTSWALASDHAWPRTINIGTDNPRKICLNQSGTSLDMRSDSMVGTSWASEHVYDHERSTLGLTTQEKIGWYQSGNSVDMRRDSMVGTSWASDHAWPWTINIGTDNPRKNGWYQSGTSVDMRSDATVGTSWA